MKRSPRAQLLSQNRWYKLRLIRILLCGPITAILLALFVVTGQAIPVAACSISANGCGSTSNTCNVNHVFNGAHWEHTSGSLPYPQYVGADISYASPWPVWSTSSAWDMLENGNYSGCQVNLNTGCFAQVGWLKWSTCSQLPVNSGPAGGGQCSTDGLPHVFTEWTSNSGTGQPVFYYNQPSGNESFQVYRDSSHNFHFYWSEGSSTAPTTVTWGPSGIQFFEEVHDYDGGCCNDGSQFGGTASSPVQFTNMFWEDATGPVYNTANMPAVSEGYGAVTTGSNGSVGTSFNAWDKRC